MGIWTIKDLFDTESKTLIPFDTFKTRGATENDKLCWIGLTKVVKRTFDHEIHSKDLICGITIEDRFMDINEVRQKNIVQLLSQIRYKQLKEADFKVRNKVVNMYNLNSDTDWNNLFTKCHNATVNNKIKELQYKILMRYVSTNSLLYEMNVVSSPSCTFCMFETEFIEHLFCECFIIKNLWFFVFDEWNRKMNSSLSPSRDICVLGKFSNTQYNSKDWALYILTLTVKYYVMQCKYESTIISNVNFVHMYKAIISLLKTIHQSESFDILDVLFDVSC